MDLLTLTLTNWFSSYKSGFFAFATVVLLASCSATKPSQPAKPTTKQAEVTQAVESALSAEQLVAQASDQVASNEQDAAVSSLLKASELYLAQTKPHKALWLAKQLEVLAESSSQKYRLAIITAASFLAIEKTPEAYLALKSADNIKEAAQLAHHVNYFQTLASVQTRRNLPIAALDANLRAFAENPLATDSDIDMIWQQLCQLSPWQITTVS